MGAPATVYIDYNARPVVIRTYIDPNILTKVTNCFSAAMLYKPTCYDFLILILNVMPFRPTLNESQRCSIDRIKLNL